MTKNLGLILIGAAIAFVAYLVLRRPSAATSAHHDPDALTSLINQAPSLLGVLLGRQTPAGGTDDEPVSDEFLASLDEVIWS